MLVLNVDGAKESSANAAILIDKLLQKQDTNQQKLKLCGYSTENVMVVLANILGSGWQGTVG